MEVHSSCPERLPSSKELRATGANQICNAIDVHGGYYAVAEKLGYALSPSYKTCPVKRIRNAWRNKILERPHC